MTRPSGVQSVERAFELLDLMADLGGEVALSQLANASDLPLPTIHRLMRTLVAKGYARQGPSRRYALGPRLIWLGERAGRLVGSWSRPYLDRLAHELGETANLAFLDGDGVVYVAQAPGRHAMRMFTEVGRHVPAHSTGVGKAMLAQLPHASAEELLARTGLPARTPRTVTDAADLLRELSQIQEQGYATDEGEEEVGVCCFAVPVPGRSVVSAVSISGPEARMTQALRECAIPLMQEVVAELAATPATERPSTGRSE